MKKYIQNESKFYLVAIGIIAMNLMFIISCKDNNSNTEPGNANPPSCNKLSKYLQKNSDGTYYGYECIYGIAGIEKINYLLPDSTIDTNNFTQLTYDGNKLKTTFSKFKFSSTDPVQELTMNFTYSNELVSSIQVQVSGGESGVYNYTYDVNGNLATIIGLANGQPLSKTVFSGYVNGRPTQLEKFDYNDKTQLYDLSEKEKYTYDADNNLIKTERMKKDETVWQLRSEYKYDLKLPVNRTKELVNNLFSFDVADFNLNTKNFNPYDPNEYVYYSDICPPGNILKKSTIATTTPTKWDEQTKLPLELLIKEDHMKCDGSSIDKTETTTVKMRYECN